MDSGGLILATRPDHANRACSRAIRVRHLERMHEDMHQLQEPLTDHRCLSLRLSPRCCVAQLLAQRKRLVFVGAPRGTCQATLRSPYLAELDGGSGTTALHRYKTPLIGICHVRRQCAPALNGRRSC